MANRPTLSIHRVGELDLLLQVEGELCNSRIRSIFGIERAQASRLITSYLEWREGQGKQKLRRRGSHWVEADAMDVDPIDSWNMSRYLNLAGDSDTSNQWFEDARIDFAEIPGGLLRELRRACLTGGGLRIAYTSLSTPGVTHRLIYPHTIVRIGRRLHVRAWCCLKEDYRDFVLPRITSLAADSQRPDKRQIKRDVLWEKKVALHFRAHCTLSEQQELAVRREFLDGTSKRQMTVRAALVPYIILEAHAATNPEVEVPPQYQIEVDNLEQIRPYLFTGEAQG